MKTISYDTAIFWQKKAKEEKIQNREEILDEIRSTCIEGLDACDINYFAAEADLSPNEVRSMMQRPNDPQDAFMAEIHSFENDETDSLFDWF